MYGEVEMQLHAILSAAVSGDKWLDLRPRRFSSEEITAVPTEKKEAWLPPEPVWTPWQREQTILPCRESKSNRPAYSLVIIVSDLSWSFRLTSSSLI
jgi:hypothetical protein